MNASHPLSIVAAEIAPPAPALGAEELFRRHAPFVARMLVRLGMPPDAIDDAVQEVFLVVHRQGGYRPGAAKPTTYLANLALHAASAHRRRQRVRGARESDVPADETASADVDATERLATGESLQRLGAALDRLEPSLRATLVLAEIEGESCPSIAASMRVPLGTVYWRLHRARKELRSALKKVDAAPRRAVVPFGAPQARREHALALSWLAGLAPSRVARSLLRAARAMGVPAGGLPVVAVVVVAALAGIGVVAGRSPGAGAPVAARAVATQATACAGCGAADTGWTAVAAVPPAIGTDAVPVELLPRVAQGSAAVASQPVARAGVATAKRASLVDPSADRPLERAVDAPATLDRAVDAPAPPDALAAPDAPAAEMRDVAEAERLLASSPTRALALVAEADARFPHGYLGEERGYVRVMALLALRRTDEARPLVATFLRAYPDGAFARRVRSAAQAARAAP